MVVLQKGIKKNTLVGTEVEKMAIFSTFVKKKVIADH